MANEIFIQSILQKGKEAKEKVSNEFAAVSLEQLNWKPSPDAWSIAQCLEHLIVSDNSYFPALQKIAGGTYQMNIWEKYSPLTGIWGWLFKDQLQEQVKKKIKAPKRTEIQKSEVRPKCSYLASLLRIKQLFLMMNLISN